MKDGFSWITPKQAAGLAGFTPRHITHLITSGKLSATREDGKYYIEKSEFFRVFPKAHRKEQEGNSAQQIAENERLASEINILKDYVSKKDKEIEFLRHHIESIAQEKMKMLDAIVSTTKLLENKSHRNEDEKEKSKSNKSWMDIFKSKK